MPSPQVAMLCPSCGQTIGYHKAIWLPAGPCLTNGCPNQPLHPPGYCRPCASEPEIHALIWGRNDHELEI